MRNAHSKRKRGISLIEAALALAVIAVSLGGLATLIIEATSNLQTRAHAERLGHVANAAALYVDTQKTKLDTFFSTTPSGTVTIPVAKQSAIGGQPIGTSGFPSLQEVGLLPSGFVDKDIFDQNLVVLIRRSSTGTRDVLLTAIGGRPLSDSQLARIASAVGAAGGAVYDELTRNPDTHVVGTASGWSYPVATWTGQLNGTTVQPSTGRPAIAITMNRAANPQGGTYLSRVATSDASDTRMASDLDMGGKNIPNVASVIATGNLDTQGQVNAQQYVWSKSGLYTEGNLWARKDITSEGNIGVKGTIQSKQGLYTDGNSGFQGDLWVGKWLHSEGGIGTHGSIQAPKGNVNAKNLCNENGQRCLYGPPDGWLGGSSSQSGFVWSGYLLLQWGKVCPEGGPVTYRFPTPFPNRVFSIQGTRDTLHPGATRASFSVTKLNNSTFSAGTSGGLAGCTDWFAIGF